MEIERSGYVNEASLIAQVHDEFIYEVEDTKVKEVAMIVRSCMESVMSLEDTCGVPLKVDVEVGKNWGEMKKMEE